MRSEWLRLARHDLRREVRGRETVLAMALVALLVVTIGLLAFHHEHAEEAPSAAAGVVWMALAFAAAVGLGRAFGAERDRRTLDVLLALPVHRGSIFLGKAAANFVLLLVVAAVVVSLHAAFSAAPVRWLAVLPVLALGALGLSAVATMLGALAAEARGRDLLLPVLLFPLVVPLLIATVHGTADVLEGAPFAAWRPEILFLAGYDLAFLAASVLLFEALTEA